MNKARTGEPAEPPAHSSADAEGVTSNPRPAGHIVLADADSDSYRSLRRRPMSRAERFELGRSLRERVHRSSLGDWKAPSNRPDPVEQIMHSHEGRLEWLIPIRVGRMVASPYGFLRGTAVVMAEDVAHLPATGITPVICGDAHLGNFGFYASPERDLVIDLNDFDEAHPGAWEWDLRRLVASIWVAGRHTGATETQCHRRRSRRVSPPTGRKCASSPMSRCCRALISGSTSTGCTRQRRIARSEARSRARQSARGNRTSDRAVASLHHRARRTALHRGRTSVDHPRARSRSGARRRRARRVSRHAGVALAPRARRLHAGRYRA